MTMNPLDWDKWADEYWAAKEQIGTLDDVDYEDEDQRLGGNDNPYPED